MIGSLFGFSPLYTSPTMSASTIAFNSNTYKVVFDAIKIVGLNTVRALCEQQVQHNFSRQTPADKMEDVTALLNSKGIRATVMHVNGGVHIEVANHTERYVSLNWLYQLDRSQLKQINEILGKLDEHKQTILDVFKPNVGWFKRNEVIEIVGGRHDPSLPHVVAKEGCVYIEQGGLFEHAVLLTTHELFVVFKENLNGLDFRNQEFVDIDLSGANLTDTNFGNATLTDVNLTGALQDGMKIKGATLLRVTGFELLPSTKVNQDTHIHDTEIGCDLGKMMKPVTTALIPFLIQHISELSKAKRITLIQLYPQFCKQILRVGLNNFGWNNREGLTYSKALDFYWDYKCSRHKPNVVVTMQSPHEVNALEKQIISMLSSLTLADVKRSPKLPLTLQRDLALYILLHKKTATTAIITYDVLDAIHTLKESLLEETQLVLNAYLDANTLKDLLADGIEQLKNEGLTILINKKIIVNSTENQHGEPISLNTHELVQEVFAKTYERLYPIDQYSLSVTNKANNQAYKTFRLTHPQLRLGQMERNFLAGKVLGPTSMLRLEKGTLSFPDAFKNKELFDQYAQEKRKKYSGEQHADINLGIERYRRDGFFSEKYINDLEHDQKHLLKHPVFLFLINSGQLTKQDLLAFGKDHWECLSDSSIITWFDEGKLTVQLFLKSAQWLNEMPYQLKNLMNKDQCTVENAIAFLAYRCTIWRFNELVNNGNTPQQAVLLAIAEKKRAFL